MFKISWPEELSKVIEDLLGGSLSELPYSRLASAILQVSDLFIAGEKAKESKTPWTDPELRRGYLSYFFPLNTLRVMRILDEAQHRGFFAGIESVVDIGSGPGTVELAFRFASTASTTSATSAALAPPTTSPMVLPLPYLQVQNFEPSRDAQRVHLQWQPQAQFVSKIPQGNSKTLFTMSYSLNEVHEWPKALDSAEALMIIEPSTRAHGRRLMEVRQQLIDKGFHLWAPCTHQLACPLLTKTKTDWCHHRFPIERSPWFEKLENHLPMQNNTLTVSYLLARKTPPPKSTTAESVSVSTADSALLTTDTVVDMRHDFTTDTVVAPPQKREPGTARIIGDTLYEKGKVRQMICRGPEREFISYLTREGLVNDKEWEGLPNGSLVRLPDTITPKGSELRLSKADLEKLWPLP